MRLAPFVVIIIAATPLLAVPAYGQTLRRLRNDEVTPAITAEAVRILRQYRGAPYGTDVPFTADGNSYVGRIERHYHPPGGARRPWGYHPGVSVFAVVGASPSTDVLDPVRQGRMLLRWGSRGSAVRAMQQALTGAGHPLNADGIFGPRTDAAVRRFQQSAGLTVDGIVGRQTMAALDRAQPNTPPPSPPPPTPPPTTPPPAPTGTVQVPFPARPAGAPGGQAFLDRTNSLSRTLREDRILQELEQGNVPSFLRTFVPVDVSAVLPSGRRVRGRFWCAPDYLSIGHDGDFVRIPTNPLTAQRVADRVGCSLPTRKMVDAIWTQAAVKLAPIPLPPTSQMMSNAWFRTHQARIERQRSGSPLGALTAGHKKDVVISNRLRTRPNRVAIYGWHLRSGSAIQPLSTVHFNTYSDYSHGVRLIHGVVEVDGQAQRLVDVLRDPVLWRLFSDEGLIPEPRIPGV